MMRLAFASHALPGATPSACHPASLLTMLCDTLKSLDGRSPRAASDACEALANHANELGAAALLRTAEDLVHDGSGMRSAGGSTRLSIDAANVLEWLDAARSVCR